MNEVVIATGIRTPVGNFGGTLEDVSAHKLGGRAVRKMITRADVDPPLIDDVAMGCVGPSSDAGNVPRMIGLMAGLPIPIPAYSIPGNCSSGLQPGVNAYQNIQREDVDV